MVHRLRRRPGTDPRQRHLPAGIHPLPAGKSTGLGRGHAHLAGAGRRRAVEAVRQRVVQGGYQRLVRLHGPPRFAAPVLALRLRAHHQSRALVRRHGRSRPRRWRPCGDQYRGSCQGFRRFLPAGSTAGALPCRRRAAYRGFRCPPLQPHRREHP